MLVRFPRYVPPLSVLLPELGNPTVAALARALDVTPRTIQRWIATDTAPLTCRLALFYVTRYGHAAVNAQAENEAQAFRSMVDEYRREAERRTRDLQRVLAMGDFGSANDPLRDVAPLVSGLPALNSAR